jgi:hypothetical protein
MKKLILLIGVCCLHAAEVRVDLDTQELSLT